MFRETDGIRGEVGKEPLTSRSMYRLGRAIGNYFDGKKILIGRDTRESGEWIKEQLSKGIVDVGGEVWDVGVVTTPCVGILTKVKDEIDGGIMITASHNPASDNGVKVFGSDGNKLTDEEEFEVEELFFGEGGFNDEDISFVGERNVEEKVFDKNELVDIYTARVIGEKRMDGWKICMDSAAGGAWGMNKSAFEKAGAQVVEVGPLPNGYNINDNCGAGFPEKLVEEVVRRDADAGVAFDGDGDRLIVVDNNGEIWDGDRIIVMLAMWLKSENALDKNTVVMTEYSNLSAVQFLERNGINVEKVLNGDRAVAWKCKEIGAVLGGEFAGHIIYPEWMAASDGLFASMMLMNAVRGQNKKMSDLRPKYENFPKKIWNIEVRERLPIEEINGWLPELKKQQAVLGSEGRVFARYSGTEDLLRILVESKDTEKMKQVGEKLSEIIIKEIGK